MIPNFTLYIREGCHLCEAFLDEFTPIAHRHLYTYELVDVDSSPQLVHEYGSRVPLLMANQEIICEYFLDPAKLDEYVQRLKVG